MKASYTKLGDGSWGIQVEDGIPKTGDMMLVQRPNGEEKIEKVGKFIDTYRDNTGKGIVNIFTIANKDQVFTRQRNIPHRKRQVS